MPIPESLMNPPSFNGPQRRSSKTFYQFGKYPSPFFLFFHLPLMAPCGRTTKEGRIYCPGTWHRRKSSQKHLLSGFYSFPRNSGMPLVINVPHCSTNVTLDQDRDNGSRVYVASDCRASACLVRTAVCDILGGWRYPGMGWG
ncbi:hypothetical protein CDAR_454911 [Caerostris darwini]|uniref:Uncharacterized protein n=1 Tax=Caerostris darwini TaxID=1538125 RepID=A0AAV4WPA4_9ARAC|nr:hypothetical protein CDAR_454911 [Caerostris darwini]